MKRAAIIVCICICVICVAYFVIVVCGVFHESLAARLAKAVRVQGFDINPISRRWSESDLGVVGGSPIDSALFRRVAERCRFLRGSYHIWKGAFLAIVDYEDGQRDRLAIGYRGKYFAVLGKAGRYEVAEEDAALWEAECERIIQDVFIPKRIEVDRRRELEKIQGGTR